ncbi:hypothetical protein P1X14_04525 [Sphingomonas sp. AOB5]|uniref:tetratricopeptide repeat protein n=1 Tax=Sphingomonas sp. AOB5 TaxID=3034017 RepID=UPI0023F88EDB|nr:hypothetical protein [Sphingomonas sp. AOB5]MDF7774501.1 hypothetical protein [Sphingomonas sp. AOB5]
MKMVSKLAIASAVALGIVAMPASAQRNKKEEPAQGQPPVKVSEEFRKHAAPAEAALKAGDWATAERELTAAEAVAKTDDEKFFTSLMRMPIEIHKQSRPGIIAAADVLLASPRTPAANLGLYNFYRGQATFQSLEAGKRAPAEPFLLKARELGVNEVDVPLMLAQIYDETNRRPQGVIEMGKAIEASRAKGQKPPESWYRWVTSRLAAAGDRSATADWQMRHLRDYPTVSNWRQVIINYRNGADKQNPDRVERINLYRLLRGTGALADTNDYFEYASAAQIGGLPWEAIWVIEDGQKNGKVSKDDADFNRVYNASKTAAANEGSLDSLAKAAKTGRDFSDVADAYLASGNYARALELYDTALSKGGANTNAVNLHRGVTLVNLGRKDEAKTAFQAVTGAGALTDIAKFWLLWMELPPLTA